MADCGTTRREYDIVLTVDRENFLDWEDVTMDDPIADERGAEGTEGRDNSSSATSIAHMINVESSHVHNSEVEVGEAVVEREAEFSFFRSNPPPPAVLKSSDRTKHNAPMYPLCV